MQVSPYKRRTSFSNPRLYFPWLFFYKCTISFFFKSHYKKHLCGFQAESFRLKKVSSWKFQAEKSFRLKVSGFQAESFSTLSNSIRPTENVGEGFVKTALLHILLHFIVLDKNKRQQRKIIASKPSSSLFLL